MKNGSFVFEQLLEAVSKIDFLAIVRKRNGDYKVQEFDCWLLFLCHFFGQLTNRENLRDLATCLKTHNKGDMGDDQQRPEPQLPSPSSSSKNTKPPLPPVSPYLQFIYSLPKDFGFCS